MNDKLKRIVVITRKNKNCLTYTYPNQLLKVYPNLCKALRVLLKRPVVWVAGFSLSRFELEGKHQ